MNRNILKSIHAESVKSRLFPSVEKYPYCNIPTEIFLFLEKTNISCFLLPKYKNNHSVFFIG